MASLRENKTICSPARAGIDLIVIAMADFTEVHVLCVRHMAAKHQNSQI